MSTFVYNFIDVSDIKNQGTVSLSLNIKQPGLYLLQIVVCHCGANSITDNNAYWDVDCSVAGKGKVNIPIANAWDNANVVTIFSRLSSGDNVFKFRNMTGVATSNAYLSRIQINGQLIS